MDGNEPWEPEIATDLLKRAAADDGAAWAELVQRFGWRVWSIARSHRLSAADAADVSQTVWLRLVERLDQIRDPHQIGAWLTTTARRECLRMLEYQRRVFPHETKVLDEPDHRDPESLALESERARQASRALAELPYRCALLVRLLWRTPPPGNAEVAAALSISPNGVSAARARCLRRFRRLLEDGP